MQIIHFLSKHKSKIISAFVVIALFILSSYTLSLFIHGIWAFPFVRTPVAVIKTTNTETSESIYYTVYSNGDRDKIRGDNLGDLTTREGEYIPHLGKKFTSVEIESSRIDYEEDGIHRKILYYDYAGNEYDQLPITTDEDLLAVQDDFFQKISDFTYMNYRIFRDGDTILFTALCDCGFGSSERKLYRYDMTSRKLCHIGAIPESETVDWMYSL